MDGVRMQDSSEFIYDYKNNTKEQIINYVNSFSPFKKLYKKDNAIDLQDTVSKFPNFVLPDSTFKNYVSSNSVSKYTLVEFWYKSCGPCLNNMKRLNSVRDSIDKSILEIVAINDADKLNGDLLKFISKFNIKYTLLFNGQELRKKLNITAHPSTYIFDNNTRRVVYYAKGTSDGYSEEIIRHMRNLVQ
jgi:thiol-disulfide isomerase/thioredoxin